MGTVLRQHGLLIVLLTCCLSAARGLSGGAKCLNERDAEQIAGGTTVTDELRRAIDDLKDLIRIADDIQYSIQRAIQKYSSVLQRAQVDMKQAASKGGSFAS